MTFGDHTNELIGMVDGLPPFYAQRCVNRAWRQIRGAHLWSFLRGDAAISVPPLVADGRASVTQYSATVVGDATAAAAWVATGLAIPITTRQFRVLGGSIYNVIAYDGANTITLDRRIEETTNATAEYQIYKCYYEAPADFLRWESVVDPVNAYPFRRENLRRTRRELDNVDPQRQSFSNPMWFVAYKISPANRTLYELWPHPLQQLGYLGTYETKGYLDYTDDQELPPQIPEELLATGAKLMGMEWAAMQPKFAAGQWPFLIAAAKADYKDLIKEAWRNDTESFVQNFMPDEPSGRPAIIDSNWLQSHE